MRLNPDTAAEHRNGRIITFYSFKGGVGRTMALANVAWILASTGRRVLTVDWDLESPGLHKYFAPFLVDRHLRSSLGVIDAVRDFARSGTQPGVGDRTRDQRPEDVHSAAQIRRYASSLVRYDFPGGGSIDFVPSGRQDRAYSHSVSTFNWDDFYERFDGATFLDALGEDMRRHYDITLIDSRTGLSDNAGICTVQLPDAVVSCFTMNNQSIDGAVAVANSIRHHRGDGIQLFPVPTRVEDGELGKLERSRTYARQRFEEFVRLLGHSDPEKYWGLVEIPYKVFYAYEETLATFGDRPQLENSLLAAYERLTSELVGEPIEFAAPPEPLRRAWLAEFEQRGSAESDPLMIAYAPRDRIWAEWIASQLLQVGQRSTLQDVNSPALLDKAARALVLLSRESVRLAHTQRFWQAALARDTPGPGRFVVPVRLEGFRVPTPFDDREPVDLFNVTVGHAREALLGKLGLRDAALAISTPTVTQGPRFPAEPPRVWRAPARNSSFTGRDAVLELLRERLSASTAMTGPVVLQGFGGVGKTQIAVEYLHRFAADYDIVWWISADQPALVRAALADLASELQLQVAGTAAEQVQAVLEALRLGEPSPRWIVVFDNADDPNLIREFIPSGHGDVIITTPGQEWAREAWTLDVNVFERAESVELLARRVTTLSPPDANEIAEKLGDLPLAVEQAATWLATTAMTARSYLELLDEHLPRILNEPPPPGYPHPAANTWRLSQERLRESNPAAAYLLELFAFFAPEPIPTRLLDSPGMIEALVAFDPRLRDPLLHGALIRDINRFGLARVDPAIPAIRIHRLVQSVVRSDLAAPIQQERRTQVQITLAAERRGDPESQQNWNVYDRLRPHLEPSGSLDSDDPQVHALIRDMVRYLRARGDLQGSKELAERAVASWLPRLGEDHTSVLVIRRELASTLLALGGFAEARRTYEDIIPRLAGTLGDKDPYTLWARRGLAGALRGQGQYHAAHRIDTETFPEWRITYGEDHDQTLRSANNLAVSFRLVGRLQEALELDEETLRRRDKYTGSSQASTLEVATRYGRDLRDVGELERSQERLEKTLATAREVFGSDHRVTLTAAKNLVVTWRRRGRLDEAYELITTTSHGYERTMGPRHPDALACGLEVACVRSARGDHDEACQLTEDVLSRYNEILGPDHPFTLAAANDLAIFRARAGNNAMARPLIEDTAGRFVNALGPDHPYTLVCQMNLANAHIAAKEVSEALRLDEHCLHHLSAKFKREHPTVLAAAANLAVAMREMGAQQEAAARLAEVAETAARVLGPTHPNTIAIQQGTRINSDIEPAET
ncbi:FxSxx-COOH system tetratricopeptide repeat protein [Phytohabitans flavus]|uniref:FxSxx-COOH system tetratricopeptide repeat protein n=1 Tax=Phytohabitans flavus TaxID=1076124 RepID=UPI0031F0FD53